MRFEAEGSLGEGVWRRAWTETGEIRNEGRCRNAQESLRSLEEGDREASLPALPPPIARESERGFDSRSLVDRSPGDWSGKAGLQRPLRQPNGPMGSPGAVGPGVSSPREITRNRSGKAATKQALMGKSYKSSPRLQANFCV
jgi:hypothetical protein